MATTETIMFRCGAGACQHRLILTLPRARGLDFRLLVREAEQWGWVLAIVAVQRAPNAAPIPVIDLRCPECGAEVPTLAAAPAIVPAESTPSTPE